MFPCFPKPVKMISAKGHNAFCSNNCTTPWHELTENSKWIELLYLCTQLTFKSDIFFAVNTSWFFHRQLKGTWFEYKSALKREHQTQTFLNPVIHIAVEAYINISFRESCCQVILSSSFSLEHHYFEYLIILKLRISLWCSLTFHEDKISKDVRDHCH